MRYELKDQTGKLLAVISAVRPNIVGAQEGVWISLETDEGKQPTLCMVNHGFDEVTGDGWYLAVYRDVRDATKGVDLAISFFEKDGPVIQVRRGDEIKVVSLFDLVSSVKDVSGE